MTFNAEVQAKQDGPWAPAFRTRVKRVKDELGLSLQDLGWTFGFSGSFVHGLLNGKQGYNMAGRHAARVLQALEGLEVQAGLRKVASADVGIDTSDLGALVHAIHALGFSVELKPLARG
jgi:hypothetical protein